MSATGYQLYGILTENIAHIVPSPIPLKKLTLMLRKLLGRTASSISNDDDESSIRFRNATARSISDSWNLSTISKASQSELRETDDVHTCTGNLEEVVFFEFFENASLDFHKLVGYEQCQEGVVVRVDSDI